MTRLSTRLLAALVPAALLVPVSAHGATLVVDDAVGDAKAANLAAELLGDTSAGDKPFLDAPAETSTDVVRTTIDHAERRLTVTVQFRDLVETTDHSVLVRIFTPEKRYDLMAGMLDGQAVGMLSPHGSDVILVDGTVLSGDPSTKPCRTVRARYDLATDTVKASVPTACIGKPKWVQVGVGASRFKGTPLPDGSVNLAGYLDDGFRGGVSVNSIGRSPKVRRG